MFHSSRHWSVTKVEKAQELAKKLTEYSWTLCTGFEHRGYLFLNDSISEDGAAEFGVVAADTLSQVESITFGWCTAAEAFKYITDIVKGRAGEPWGASVRAEQIEREHETCVHCA